MGWKNRVRVSLSWATVRVLYDSGAINERNNRKVDFPIKCRNISRCNSGGSKFNQFAVK